MNLSIFAGIEVTPSHLMHGKSIIMLNKDGKFIGVSHIERGPFNQEMKKIVVSQEVYDAIKNMCNKTSS